MSEPLDSLIAELEDSLRWSRDHKGEHYKHAGPSEWSYQQGLLFAISLFNGEDLVEMRTTYRSKIEHEPKRTKSKVVRRRSTTTTTAAPKRKVVRRKK